MENEQNKRVEEEKNRDRRIEETGQATLNKNDKENTIHLISVIGEIEGHDIWEAIPRPQSMNIFCRSLPQLKTVKILMGY